MRRQGISGPITARNGAPTPFFPNQAARDVTVAAVVGVAVALLAWKAAPILETPADPSSATYVPRPEWYFLGLFQLLKYFPGRLEVLGAVVIPGAALLWLALLPWIDRGPSRAWRDRRGVLGAFSAGLAATIALTALGGSDRPRGRSDQWNIREVAGAALIGQTRCTRCHAPDATTSSIVAGHITRTGNWVAGHIEDPEMIAPGLRPAPAGNASETAAMLSAIARLRGGPAPTLPAAETHRDVLINRECLRCHMIDGAGSTKEADLSNAGTKHDADWLRRWITDPKGIKADTDMPEFGSKLTLQEIADLASWLASRK
jgi:mono/diheme cytochrome c family protein